MKIKMQTQSGAVYTLDSVAMTARRVGTIDIHGLPSDVPAAHENALSLSEWPDLRVGEVAYLDLGPGEYDYIRTTPIVRIEEVS